MSEYTLNRHLRVLVLFTLQLSPNLLKTMRFDRIPSKTDLSGGEAAVIPMLISMISGFTLQEVLRFEIQLSQEPAGKVRHDLFNVLSCLHKVFIGQSTDEELEIVKERFAIYARMVPTSEVAGSH
jgi:hypothetical protein